MPKVILPSGHRTKQGANVLNFSLPKHEVSVGELRKSLRIADAVPDEGNYNFFTENSDGSAKELKDSDKVGKDSVVQLLPKLIFGKTRSIFSRRNMAGAQHGSSETH